MVGTMLRRIVLTRTTGQLGNRLMVGAHVLAAAAECGATCINPAFLEYSDWFEGPRRCLATWQPANPAGTTYSPRLRQATYAATRVAWQMSKVLGPLSLGRIARARARNSKPLDLKDVIDQARGASTLLLQGYHFRHAPWAERHADLLRRFFLPLAEYRTLADAVVLDLRRTCDVVVAVHLRHGDYKTHLDGRFFWEAPVYRGFMDRMTTLLAPAKVGFLICSNARHQPSDFTGLTWRPGPGSVPGDLYAMSRCDYILGPPSSFSSWAAFQGGTRLLRVAAADQAFSLDDFAVQRAPETEH